MPKQDSSGRSNTAKTTAAGDSQRTIPAKYGRAISLYVSERVAQLAAERSTGGNPAVREAMRRGLP